MFSKTFVSGLALSVLAGAAVAQDCNQNGAAASAFKTCGEMSGSMNVCTQGGDAITSCSCSVLTAMSSCYADYKSEYCDNYTWQHEYFSSVCANGGGSGSSSSSSTSKSDKPASTTATATASEASSTKDASSTKTASGSEASKSASSASSRTGSGSAAASASATGSAAASASGSAAASGSATPSASAAPANGADAAAGINGLLLGAAGLFAALF